MKTEVRVIQRAAELIAMSLQIYLSIHFKARSMIYMCMENYLQLAKGEIRS